MTATRRRLIAHLYRSLISVNLDAEDSGFATWKATAHSVRGPLERKRPADRAKLCGFLGIEPHELDVEGFVFVTEAYMTLRAEILVDAALNLARDNGPSSSSTIRLRDLVDEAAAEDDRSILAESGLRSAISVLPDEIVEAEMASAIATARDYLGGSIFDALQIDHQELVPKELRHMTGVYYTPQPLADYVLSRTGYSYTASRLEQLRVMDPSCGSGVFLVAAAEQLRRSVETGQITRVQALKALSQNLVGFDVDPLAIVQARANVRLAAIAIGDVSDSVRSANAIVLRDSLEYDSSIPRADIVVGNPPWVNWEYLPPDYRDKHQMRWPELGLFDLKGRDRAFSKEDISALFLAVSVDQYLKDDGHISFIVPQSLVKSSLNQRAFRRFSLRHGAIQYRVDEVEDMVAIRPFEGVANRTIVIHATRGDATTYPVRYTVWKKNQAGLFDSSKAEVAYELAEPSNSADLTSHWTTGPRETLEALKSVTGECAYRARTGLFTGGANAVFQLSLERQNEHTVVVRNITERAKRAVDPIEAEIEVDYVYPFLRGRDVEQWKAQSEIFTLLPHTATTKMDPVGEKTLRINAPMTYKYFENFRKVLAERGGFVGWERKALDVGFYACQRVGEYTFADWKVAWRYIASKFTCAVIGPFEGDGPFAGKAQIPNEKLMTIACGSAEEAYYLCGLLSTSCAVSFIHSRMVSTQIAPHLIQGLRLPKFDSTDGTHTQIAKICAAGHSAIRDGGLVTPGDLDQLDALGADLLGASVEGALQLRRQLVEDGFRY